MSTNNDIERDSQIVAECLETGRPIPAEVALRVQERAAKAREELRKSHGVQSSGVQIIREMRGELPAL
jgi:hypothetical protein